LAQSLVHTGGVFNYKDFAKRLKDWSQHGLVAISKPPVGVGQSTQCTISHPTFEQDPVSVFFYETYIQNVKSTKSCVSIFQHRAAADVWHSKHILRSANGAITRAPLLGIVKFWDGTTVIENSADCCRVTHPDPRSIASCAIVSTLVARMLRSQDTEYNDYPPSPTSSPINHYQDQMLRSPSNTPPLSNLDLAQKTKEKKYFIDTLSTDPCLLSLVDSAIEANNRCLTAPNTDPLFHSPETDHQLMQTYYQQLLAHCYPPVQLDSLALDQTDDNQDVFKTLGAAIYGFTRKLPKGEQTSSFKRILMDIVLQGGDADTNASVTGALLGLRIGYSMLPSEWVVGLKHWEWLEDCVEEFVDLL
jgi:ADP-ribosylglycohydrolase